jgi:hypothetical protein
LAIAAILAGLAVNQTSRQTRGSLPLHTPTSARDYCAILDVFDAVVTLGRLSSVSDVTEKIQAMYEFG